MSWHKKITNWLLLYFQELRVHVVSNRVRSAISTVIEPSPSKNKKLPSKEDLKKEFNTDRMLDTAKGPIKLSPKQKAAVKYNTKKKTTK
tara:strand:- start:72 stop:338 length:267 start_codon:yes stop_codon:yes gene_type:complete